MSEHNSRKPDVKLFDGPVQVSLWFREDGRLANMVTEVVYRDNTNRLPFRNNLRDSQEVAASMALQQVAYGIIVQRQNRLQQ